MRKTLGAAGLALLATVATGCGVGVRGDATQITTTGAVLNGRVVSTAGGPASYHFEYGREQPLQQTPEASIEVGKGFAPAVSARVDGLEPGGPYRFRVCAEDSENPGDPRCSPFRAFSIDAAAGRDYAVGDFVSDNLHYVVDVHSDPVGGDPVGEVTVDEGRVGSVTIDAVCLAVDGTRATIGGRFPSVGDVFFILEDDPAGQDRYVLVPAASGQSVTDCPAGPSTLPPIDSGNISIHGAPTPP
jgi:hypothetical protein